MSTSMLLFAYKQPDSAERRANLIEALEALVRQLAPYPALAERRDTLAGLVGLLRVHDDAASVPGDLALLRAALVLQTQDLELLARYNVRAEFAPGAAVALLGRGTSTTLKLTNRSSQPARRPRHTGALPPDRHQRRQPERHLPL